MKVFTYSEARQHLSQVLNTARKEVVLVKRRGGDIFSISYSKKIRSPLDVRGIRSRANTHDILTAVRESREAERGASANG